MPQPVTEKSLQKKEGRARTTIAIKMEAFLVNRGLSP